MHSFMVVVPSSSCLFCPAQLMILLTDFRWCYTFVDWFVTCWWALSVVFVRK